MRYSTSSTLVLLPLFLGCSSDGAATPYTATPEPVRSAPVVTEASANAEMSTKPVEILKFTFTSGVEAKNPVDSLTTAKPGAKVWAHLTVRNRTGSSRKVNVEFELNGKTRTQVELSVDESWSWRTWAYNTVPKDATGTLRAIVTDDEGHPLGDYSIPIGP